MEPNEKNSANPVSEVTKGQTDEIVAKNVTGETVENKENKEAKESEKKSNRGLYIGLGIGGGALVVGGIVAAILIPKLLLPDYKVMHEQASALYGDLSNFVYNSKCYKVSSNVKNTYSVSSETYKKYIEECKNDANSIYGKIDQFENDSGVMKDSETKELFEKFLTVFDNNAPGADKLEATLKAYEGMHEFAEGMEDVGYYDMTKLMSTDEFLKIVNNLIDSGSEKLKTFGEGLKQRYETLYKAGQDCLAKQKAYQNTSFSSGNWNSAYKTYSDARDKFNDATEDFYDYYSKDYPKDDELDVHLVDYEDYGDGSIMDTFDNLQRAIMKKL